MKYRRFKLQPFPKSEHQQYWWVYFFDTRQEMHRYIEKHILTTVSPDTAAQCSNYEAYAFSEEGTENILPEIGKIFFYKGVFGSGVVAHELTHAALYFFTKVLKHKYEELYLDDSASMANEVEEALCSLLQCLTKSFWKKYYKLELKW